MSVFDVMSIKEDIADAYREDAKNKPEELLRSAYSNDIKLALETLVSIATDYSTSRFGKDIVIRDDICLMHQELSELLDAYREGNPPSEKVPNCSKAEEELADVIMRALAFAGRHNFNIFDTIIEKHVYNVRKRPPRHGKLF